MDQVEQGCEVGVWCCGEEKQVIIFRLSDEEIERLRVERFEHPDPRIQLKMEVLLLKSHGLWNQQIMSIAGVSENTIRKYMREYEQGGIEGLKEYRWNMPQSELEPHRQMLQEYFEQHPPATVAEAAAAIEKLTGIKRKLTQVRRFLRSMGLRPRKVGSIPAKADPKKQETFKQEALEPQLEQARRGSRLVYFIDAAHFVLAPFLGILWSTYRRFIQAPSGRKRFNVLGALNAVTNELVSVTNDSYINAGSVCDLLRKLASSHADIPMTLVLDNARYQKCKLVQALADSLSIKLLYLPPYSPNLNLIERLWKFVKKKVLYSKYYSDFSTFCAAIRDCLDRTQTDYQTELDSLLTHNFQTFILPQEMAA